jgi:hypothetical protein
MAIHVQDAEADALLREFARRRGLGITEAIKVAVKEANKHERESVAALAAKIAPLQEEVRRLTKRRFTEAEKKAILDQMWET